MMELSVQQDMQDRRSCVFYFAIQRQKLSGMAHAPILTSDIVKFLEICSN